VSRLIESFALLSGQLPNKPRDSGNRQRRRMGDTCCDKWYIVIFKLCNLL